MSSPNNLVYQFHQEYLQIIDIEMEIAVTGNVFLAYFNTLYTSEAMRRLSLTKDDLNDLFPTSIEDILQMHRQIYTKVIELQEQFKDFIEKPTYNKELMSQLISALVSIYYDFLERIMETYTSLFHKICVSLYAAEHSFPVLPRRMKINSKGVSLAQVYVNYIEYIPNLFKGFVNLVRHLSGNDMNWDKGYDLVYTLRLADATVRDIYSDYPNKTFQNIEYFPTDRLLLREDRLRIISDVIEIHSDNLQEDTWIQQNEIQINSDDTLLLIPSSSSKPLQFWLNDITYEFIDNYTCKVQDITPIKPFSWEDLIVQTQQSCKVRRLFGKDLTTYMKQNEEEETGFIPMALEKCFSFGRRKKGDGKVLNKIIPLINLGKDFEMNDIAVAAEFLKMYLRNLPEPLLTFGFIPDLIENATIGKSSVITSFLVKLPFYNKALLNRLMKLCYRITLNKDQTGIDSLTLAKILAPNLCWLEKGGIPGNIYHLVEMLIVEYVIIFEDIDKELLEKEQSYLDIKKC
ncbi:RhoGAP domain containing protein [Entamoeba marina]